MEPTIGNKKLNEKINKFITITLLVVVLVAIGVYVYQHLWVLNMKSEAPAKQENSLTEDQKQQILSNLETSKNPVSDDQALQTLQNLNPKNQPVIPEAKRKDILKSL
jgi:cell division protein YceG involved in septum cleavage